MADELAPSIPPDGVVEVVFDADLTNEIDDEFALIYALLSPERIRPIAIHAAPYSLGPHLVEAGAVPELQATQITQDLDALGLDLSAIPVKEPGPSMELAYERALEIAELMEVELEGGIHRGSDRFMSSQDEPVPSAAVTNLIALAQQPRDERLVVIASGALTNVASALLTEPAIADRLIVVWTAAYPSFWPHENASFNLVQDIPAFRAVFESGVPIVYIPGYFVGEKLRVTRPEMVEYVAEKGPLGDYLFELYEDHALFGNHYAKSKVLWDMVSVGYVIDPTWFAEKQVGPLALDEERRWMAGQGADVIEPHDVDRDSIFKDFYDKLDESTP